ncbi:MAG: hypothetical protein ACRCVW_00700 [Brevinema sp.]
MRYLTFQGKTQKEAFEQLNQAKKLDPAFKEVRLITHNEKQVPSFMGLKKDTIYEIMVGIPEFGISDSNFNIPVTAEPKKFSSIEKSVLQSSKKIKSSKEEVEETLFAIESVNRVAEKISQLEKKDPVVRPTLTKIAPKNMEIESLQSELTYIKQEFQNMKNLLSTHVNKTQNTLFQYEMEEERSLPNEHEICKQHIRWINNYLSEKDFSRYFIDQFINSIEQNPEVLKDKNIILNKAKEHLKEHIPVKNINLDHYEFGTNIIFVGSTGVGKTNSLIKLAAHLGLARKKRFRFISIDRYKAGNDSQLEILSSYMRSSFYSVSQEDEFINLVNHPEDKFDYTFIDTAGKSPTQNVAIQELAHWVNKIEEQTDIHLVVSATTKASDLEMILESYSCLNINHLFVTKTDETNNLGSVLSLAYKHHKSLSFLTDGQEIPQDFKIADTNRLIHDSLF